MNIGSGMGLPFGRPSFRENLSALLLSDGATVANYRMGVGLTGTTNASAWANQIGTAGPLLQASGAAQPAIQADGSLLFDGVDDRMTAVFTLDQPVTLYLVFKQITWSSNDYFCDGVVAQQAIRQAGTGTTIAQVGSLPGASDATFGLDVYGVITSVYNGASSILKVDGGTNNTGDIGVGNPGGFILGSDGAPVVFSNIQVKESIIRNVADSADTRTRIQGLLKAIYGTP